MGYKDMTILLCVCFLGVVPYLMGLLLNHIVGERNIGQIETYLSGFLFLFLCQGLLFFAGVVGKISFHKMIVIQTIFYLFGVGLVLFLKRKKLRAALRFKQRTDDSRSKLEKITFLVFFVVFLATAYRIISYQPLPVDDTVLETIQTTLATDRMYCYHPLTGKLLEVGMIISKKWITLPLWYGYLANLFKIEPSVLIYHIVPIFVLLVSYFSYGRLAYLLFQKDKQKTMQFVIVYGLLVLSGDYITHAFGYRQLFYGYRGETITFSVLLPYALTVLYEVFGSYLRGGSWKMPERKQIIRIAGRLLLVLGASVFLTSIPTGVLFLLLEIALFSLVVLLQAVRRRILCR